MNLLIFKVMTKQIISNLLNLKLRISLANGINKIARIHKIKSKIDTSNYKKKWKKLCWFVNTKWYKVYSSISGIQDINYVPEDIYYAIIEPKLNNRELARAYADKNSYEKYYNLKTFPLALARNIHGIYFDTNYNMIEESNILNEIKKENKIIIKPTIDSMSGKNVELFIRNNKNDYYNQKNELLSLEYLKKKYKSDFIIQKYIDQHDFYKQFNALSLNSVRVYTYRSVKTNKIVVLKTVLKIGKKGLVVDNQNAGGICCEINDKGFLYKYGVDKYCRKVNSFDDNKKFEEVERIYKIDEIKEVAAQIANENYHFRLLGLDICVNSDNEVIIIELNNHYLGLNAQQISGESFFKEFTDEIIDYCLIKDN